MFWRKLSGASYEFVAIKSFREIRPDKHSYGKREYEFVLVDGSKEVTVLEQVVWQRLELALSKGGMLVNA